MNLDNIDKRLRLFVDYLKYKSSFKTSYEKILILKETGFLYSTGDPLGFEGWLEIQGYVNLTLVYHENLKNKHREHFKRAIAFTLADPDYWTGEELEAKL